MTPKRNFYYSGHNLPIRIETSDRPSHQLVSRVLRTLLLDVLGYSKVELVAAEAGIDATRALNRFTRYVVVLSCRSSQLFLVCELQSVWSVDLGGEFN